MNQSVPPPNADRHPEKAASTTNDEFQVSGVTYESLDQHIESPMASNATTAPGSTPTSSPTRRYRLQRSERLQSGSDSPTPPNSAHSHSSSGGSGCGGGGGGGSGRNSGQYSSWEVLIRDSFGQIAWPIKFTSWELIDDNNKLKECVSTRWVKKTQKYIGFSIVLSCLGNRLFHSPVGHGGQLCIGLLTT